MKLKVKKQTKVRLTACKNPKGQDKKEPECYILFGEKGGSNEFWAKMIGENALLVFKPGQEVEVELSFHVYKNSHKCRQRVEVKSISLVKDDMFNTERWPWDY
jgi:hypothetical protein